MTSSVLNNLALVFLEFLLLKFQSFNVQLKDENLPELEERFVIQLINATSDDGLSGTTNVSGASIDLANSRSTVMVRESDFPYGLLQFSESEITPLPDDPLIPPATERPTVSVPMDLYMPIIDVA